MPERERESDRDILIDLRGMVFRLVESRDDHESRLRKVEGDIADTRTSKREQDASIRRLIGWGMLLAAMAGAFGHLAMQTINP